MSEQRHDGKGNKGKATPKAEIAKPDEERFGRFDVGIVTSGVWASLSPKAKAVYPVLVIYAHSVNRQAWPSTERLAKEAGIHVNVVSAATKELQRVGLIKKWTYNRRNRYHLRRGGYSLSPSSMGTETPLKRAKRVRDPRGRFISPSTMVASSPSSMEATTPCSMEGRLPSIMGTDHTNLSEEDIKGIYHTTPSGKCPDLSSLLLGGKNKDPSKEKQKRREALREYFQAEASVGNGRKTLDYYVQSLPAYYDREDIKETYQQVMT